jgi:septal ring factor EnvC (AmiA/AmiB activator)
MDTASEAILSLQPVTFHYKHELDPADIPQFGLIAEQVEKVSPDLVAHDEQGKPYSVRYEAVNSMLLNEFLKEHRNGQEQDATISQLKSTLVQQHNDFQSALADQQKQITALTTALQDQAAQIQKVSVQLVADKKTSYVVVNDR